MLNQFSLAEEVDTEEAMEVVVTGVDMEDVEVDTDMVSEALKIPKLKNLLRTNPT